MKIPKWITPFLLGWALGWTMGIIFWLGETGVFK